ncbi:MAG: phosphopentomutase [Deltaproteobacteria bacterium]|nr:phosphopentomutase [Deltaproteobacteria bacterium]
MPLRRAIVIVFDSLGCGEMPDAAVYGDEGSDTIDNISRAVGGLRIPNLAAMGLGLIEGITAVPKAQRPCASYGRMREASPGKDTSTGHWEIAGIRLDAPFPTYPRGLPLEMLEGFTQATGYAWLGGMAASGTEIIERLGPEHLRTGSLIVYTSADSVFQIAGHEAVVAVEELYRVCERTRVFLDPYNIARVIARPFAGSPGSFKRTHRRKDFSMPPPRPTVLEAIKAAGRPVTGIGKIGDIFAHRGLTSEIHTTCDMDGFDKTIEAVSEQEDGLIFTNLVDFDTLYGHRNDAAGYAAGLEAIDARLPELMEALDKETILIITADHGCDPTTASTDHSREYVPLLVYHKHKTASLKTGIDLGTRQTFADVGATLAEVFGVSLLSTGVSFLPEIV